MAFRAYSLAFLGRHEEAIRGADEAESLGKERGDVGAEVLGFITRMDVVAKETGDGRRVETLGRELAERFHEAGPWRYYGLAWAGLGRFWLGDTEQALELLDRAADLLTDRSFSAWARGWRFRVAAYAGRSDVMPLYEALQPELSRIGVQERVGGLIALHEAIEGLAALGEYTTAAKLYPDAVESLGFGTVATASLVWQCTTAIAAACGDNWDVAEQHFSTALRQAEEIPHVMAQFDTRRWWAWMLLRRGGWRSGKRPRVAPGGRRRVSQARGAALREDRAGDARG